jgi:hypothetical protein
MPLWPRLVRTRGRSSTLTESELNGPPRLLGQLCAFRRALGSCKWLSAQAVDIVHILSQLLRQRASKMSISEGLAALEIF